MSEDFYLIKMDKRQTKKKNQEQTDTLQQQISERQNTQMIDRQQSLTYHSLHRHVQSIMPQHENKGYSTIYSSNKQPRLPSILQMSRQKKSHEKSLKKGISRVSKSKKDLMENTNVQTKDIDTGKSMSKGTLLNFNIQQVVENRYHLTRPKDEIIQKSPIQIKIKEEQRTQKGSFRSNEKSFISQYRIVTYVPQGYGDLNNTQNLQKMDNTTESKQLYFDKENNLNESNIQNNNHKKNDSEQIQIRNPVNEPILELQTWRTSSNFDPYYTNNFNTEMTKSNFMKYEKPYSSFQQKYSIPLTVNMEEIAEKNSDVQGLKDKIKHLEHEIVDIEREKTSLIKENEEFKKENYGLKKQNEQLDAQHKKMSKQLESLYPQLTSLQEKVRVQDQEIQSYIQQLRLISKTSQKLSNSELYQQQEMKNSQKKEQIEDLQAKISELQIINATISRQLSEKSLSINDLNRRNHELSERLSEMERALKRSDDELEDKQVELLRKVQQINQLGGEIETLQQCIDNERSQTVYQYHSLPGNSQPQPLETDYLLLKQELMELKQELQDLNEKYEQKVRDYNHLQKKHNFMKDQLEHLKYLQTNGASSYRSLSSNHNHTKNYESDQLPNYTTSQHQQYIVGLQTRLEITERNLKEVEEEYSNLKQNFRALEELYVKQQQQNDQIQQQLTNFTQENKRLKIQLTNQEEISKAKTIKLKEENEGIKLMEKEQIIISLKRELNSLERYKLEIEDSQNYLQQELQELNEKYLKEVEKNTQFSIKHKEDLALFTQDIQKQQQEKTSLIVQNYENLISKLNQQITFLKDQAQSMKDKNFKELLTIQDLYKELQQLKSERFQKQYALEQVGAKRQLQKFSVRLQQECKILEIKCKKLEIQKQTIENDLVQNISKINLYEQDIMYYKEQKNKSIKQKLELSNELQKVNQMMLQLRKLNCSLEEQRIVVDKKLEENSVKYVVYMKENQVLMQNVKSLTIKLSEKQIQIDNFDASLRDLRISLLEEKQSNEKKQGVIESLKVQCENHKSKEEYYKMMYENTSQQLELSRQQIQALLLQNQMKSIKSSPIKELQTMKKSFFNDYVITMDIAKDRETQLYRIEVYKDLNQILNLTLQNFTLQQILQQNEQEYLRKLFNAIKEDHDKLVELKQLIVDMEEGFKREKVHIKQDYDLVYEKYLKYKSMCQVMEKDIERYKLKLKKKEDHFASIKI